MPESDPWTVHRTKNFPGPFTASRQERAPDPPPLRASHAFLESVHPGEALSAFSMRHSFFCVYLQLFAFFYFFPCVCVVSSPWVAFEGGGVSFFRLFWFFISVGSMWSICLFFSDWDFSRRSRRRRLDAAKDVVFSFVLIVATITIELTTGTSGRRTDLSYAQSLVPLSLGGHLFWFEKVVHV